MIERGGKMQVKFAAGQQPTIMCNENPPSQKIYFLDFRTHGGHIKKLHESVINPI